MVKRNRKFGALTVLKLAEKAGGALQKGIEIKNLMEVKPEPHYVGALKKLDEVKGGKTIQNGITTLTKQLETIEKLTIDSPVFTNFMKPVLAGLKTDLSKEEGFATTKETIEVTKTNLKAMTNVQALTGQYNTIKTEIMKVAPQDKSVADMHEIITKFTMPVNLQDKLRESLPSSLLLFLIEPGPTPDTNTALATFTSKLATTSAAVTTATAASFGRRKKMSQEKRIIKIQKISKELSKKMSREEILSITAISINALAILAGLSAFLLNKGKTKVDNSDIYFGDDSGIYDDTKYVVENDLSNSEGDFVPAENVGWLTKALLAAKEEEERHVFGKRKKKKLSATLKRMCKKYKVRLTTKRNGKKVYKSEKVLKKQCKNALKRRKK